jgi:hypothetical protein
MAIGTPTSIGTNSGAGPTTLNLTTTGAVPVDGLIVIVGCWGFASARTATASGGGLTWTTDHTQGFTSGYEYRLGIFSAPAPAGLASSSTLTLTAGGGNVDGLLMAASYTTGLDQSGTREDTSTGTGASINTWSTGTASTTNADDLIIGGSFHDGLATNTATGGATEVTGQDFQFAGNAWSMVVEYKIVASAGSQSLTGTWTATTNQVCAFAAYKGDAGTPWVPETDADETVRVNQSMLRF